MTCPVNSASHLYSSLVKTIVTLPSACLLPPVTHEDTCNMASPARPALKRTNSKVRFSRADMSPVGTMASDSTVHGVHGQHSQSQPQNTEHGYEYEQEQPYDINSYPFSEEISLSTSTAPEPQAAQYYREPQGENAHPLAPDARYEPNDGYTNTPPRVGGSKRWSIPQHRPSLDPLLSADPRLVQDVSPRGSILGAYDTPTRSPYQGSPHSRGSAIRSSLVMPHAGSPRDATEYPENPYRNTGTRSSAPVSTTPRRLLDQHRPSAPEFGSPVVGSPQYGSPRGSPNPAIRRYPEYEAPPDRLSPVPPYQSPRNSYARPGGKEWEDQRRYDRYNGRHDSDTTLHGEEERKGSFNKGYNRPRSFSSDSGKSAMGRGENAELPMRRKTTREMEDDEESYRVKGGVFSQLLRLTGRSSTLRRRISSRGASSQGYGPNGELPTMKTLGLKRDPSIATTVFGADELDREDPRVTGQKKKIKRRNSFSDLPWTRNASQDGGENPRRKRRASIQYHVAGEPSL